MSSTKINKIIFIDDNGKELARNIPLPVARILDAIGEIPRGHLVSRKIILTNAGYNPYHIKSSYKSHDLVKPHIIIIKETGKVKAFYGHPDDVANKKKEFDKAGKWYR